MLELTDLCAYNSRKFFGVQVASATWVKRETGTETFGNLYCPRNGKQVRVRSTRFSPNLEPLRRYAVGRRAHQDLSVRRPARKQAKRLREAAFGTQVMRVAARHLLFEPSLDASRQSTAGGDAGWYWEHDFE